MRGLEEVTTDINAHTKFHNFGAFLYKRKIIANLENRLWSQHWLAQDDTIDRPLPPIVLVSGLQRTGTTFLQRLLGQLPEFRGILSWELLNPVPRSKKKTYYGKLQARIGHAALNYINPAFKTIHSVDAESLEEEVVLMDHTFMSSITETILEVPNYSRWLEQQNQNLAYQDLKMWLQFLMWRNRAQHHLLLKSPHHMEYMDQFVGVFPETKVITMHRTPVETIASFCSMVVSGKKMFQGSADLASIGQHWMRKNKRLVTRYMDYCSGDNREILDLAYDEFVKDPLTTLEEIYAFMDLQLTDQHIKIAEDFMAEHRRNRYGKHTYDLADYNLTPEQVEEHFSDYMSAYSQLM